MFTADCRKSLKHQLSLKLVQWKPNCSMRTHRHQGNSSFLQFSTHVQKDALRGEHVSSSVLLWMWPNASEQTMSDFRMIRHRNLASISHPYPPHVSADDAISADEYSDDRMLTESPDCNCDCVCFVVRPISINFGTAAVHELTNSFVKTAAIKTKVFSRSS
jgi:hypothetical protein